MNKKLLLVILFMVGALSCGQLPGQSNIKDVEGAMVRDPDWIMLTNNVDKHPNIVELCAGGFGFWTTTRPDFSAAERLPELDSFCKSVKGQGQVTVPAHSDKPASWNSEPS